MRTKTVHTNWVMWKRISAAAKNVLHRMKATAYVSNLLAFIGVNARAPTTLSRRYPIYRHLTAIRSSRPKKRSVTVEQLYLFKKIWANPGLFLFIFGLFKQTIHFLQLINVKKLHVQPVYDAGI